MNTPAGQGLLSGVAHYAAGAGRGGPVNSIGRGLLGGLSGYQGANDRITEQAQLAKRNELFDLQLQQGRMQMTQAQEQAAREAAIRDAAKASTTQALPGMGMLNGSLPPELQTPVMPGKPGGLDVQGFLSRVSQIDPLRALDLQQKFKPEPLINKLDAKDFTPDSVQKFNQSGNYADLVRLDKLHFADTGGAVAGLNPFTGQPVGSVPKTGNPFNDLVLSDGAGGFKPNSPLIGAKQGIAKAGATQLRIENKMGEGVAAQVGPMLRDSMTAANGAAQQIDAATRIIAAADSGKLIAGPGAGVRLKLAQVGQVLGIGGKDDAERIAKTRQTIRGLAEMTLQGRKQMRGEGAITESEGALAEKAMSGNIEDLTVAEIKQLAQASDRSARFVYGQHEAMLGNLEGSQSAGLAKFYKPLPLPASPKVVPVAPAGAPAVPGVRFLGFE
ncbi:hypothetical protein WG922_21630 [Ramlibacter sp. AN1015]|uniref:hypothetical protein n=1 Tax=Ramlibacter sp. AN1015 TaxID=3133428 RepID=UPI0030C373E0